MRRNVVVAVAAVVLASASLVAHHAFSAEFDVNKPLTLEGKLVRWEMINPHSWFHIEVTEEDGTVVPWQVEGGSPNELIRNGVTQNSVEVGTVLTIEGYRAKERNGESGRPQLRARRRIAVVPRRLGPERRCRAVDAFRQTGTALVPMTMSSNPTYEYACHEGNYCLEGILAGHRAEDRVARRSRDTRIEVS